MLERIRFPEMDGRADAFPFNISALQGLEVLEFAASVTLFVGENGSGKSTVLEALAGATRLPTTPPLARQLARGPAAGSIAAIERKYGANLDANSHGEAFLKLFRERFVPGGLATHSPILMAIPNAIIYSLDQRPVGRVEFQELEHVWLMRDFLSQPERFLRHVWTDGGG